jgi:two-component system phosphate regulon sensor histidine kinase PhoR
MLRSRLFWKLFLGFTLVNLLTAAALVAATWGWQQEGARQLVKREVATMAAFLTPAATAWAENPAPETEESVRSQAAKVGAAVRIRLSDEKQLAIGKTSTGRSDRIQERVNLGPAAKPLGELIVERPDDQLGESLARLATRYALFFPFIALVTLGAGYAVIAHLVSPVQALHKAAIAMASGAYKQRAFVTNRDELGALAGSFNKMSEELGQRLSQLQESDRRQATVLGGMIEGVVAVDDRQRVLFANDAAGRLFDFDPHEVENRPLLEVVRSHPLHQAVKAAIASRAPQRLEVEWDARFLSVQVTPLIGEPAGAVVVLHDTTDLRRLENLRRDFVANVSHELKTPLSTIKANAETLSLGAVDDKENRMRFIDGISKQSERLEALIQDMLTLARIESAQQPFDIAKVNLEKAVVSCLKDFADRAEMKRLDLRAVPPQGIDKVLVRADRNGFRVILSNLVDNAVKYSPDGGQVMVSWAPTTVNGSPMVRIEVTDTGSGIPEEKQARVFERFYRVDEARSRDRGGTGLGLSIVKHLTQSFGGDVAVANRPEGGAVFTVTLPAA